MPLDKFVRIAEFYDASRNVPIQVESPLTFCAESRFFVQDRLFVQSRLGLWLGLGVEIGGVDEQAAGVDEGLGRLRLADAHGMTRLSLTPKAFF